LNLWRRLSVGFGRGSRFSLRHLQAQLTELESEHPNIKLPDVAVIEIAKGSAFEVDAIEQLKKTRFSKVPVVAISSHLDQEIVRGLMRLKVDDWLPADCSPAELQKACEKAFQSKEPGEAVRHAKCTTFLPANGGCGNTTLAIETALLLKSQKKRETVCLVDLNFQDGAVADYLDLSPNFKISELSQLSGRLDRHMLDVMLTRHSSGLPVLAAPRLPGQFVDINGDAIASILGLLAESFDHLIIDLPKNWYPWTDNVIWGSDRIFIVATFTIPALRQARFLADAMRAKVSPEVEVSVIVNKFHEPLMGPGLTRKDAAGILADGLAGFVPNLGGVVDDAINRGVTLSEMRAGNKIEKRLLEILNREVRVAKA
jgi:pilus assembly protein CpaE